MPNLGRCLEVHNGVETGGWTTRDIGNPGETSDGTETSPEQKTSQERSLVDQELVMLLGAWHSLPDEVRSAIMTLARFHRDSESEQK